MKHRKVHKEHFTKMIRTMMEEEAWSSLSPTAQALYPWLKLEWKGLDYNNNGKIRLSVRQAAKRLGVGINTAAAAFHDLQAKGFLIVTEKAHLGISGAAKGPSYELTELAMPHTVPRVGKRLYKQWKPDSDFTVIKARANNPMGNNGKNSHRNNEDNNVITMETIKNKTSSN